MELNRLVLESFIVHFDKRYPTMHFYLIDLKLIFSQVIDIVVDHLRYSAVMGHIGSLCIVSKDVGHFI